MSPHACPCGYYGDTDRQCVCTPHQARRYLSRLSGPLLDRIDIHIEVPRLPYEEVNSPNRAESSAAIKERVEEARNRQRLRLAGDRADAKSIPLCNARMGPREVRRFCNLASSARTLLREAFKKFSLSARSHDKILRTARTIADLDGAEIIKDVHIAEAIQYRSLDRVMV